jgi:hypothetical protein
LFLIIVSLSGHPKGVGELTSNFLRGGGDRHVLARVPKDGVQFWYNDTFTVRGGGVQENVPLENL